MKRKLETFLKWEEEGKSVKPSMLSQTDLKKLIDLRRTDRKQVKIVPAESIEKANALAAAWNYTRSTDEIAERITL